MSASLRRLGRLIGIILIFSVVGPLAFAALTSLIVVAFGAALLQLLLAFVDLSALRPTFSIAVVAAGLPGGRWHRSRPRP